MSRFAGFGGGVGLPMGLQAQSVTPCIQNVTFSSFKKVSFGRGPEGASLAYAATVKQTYKQKLFDGNALHREAETIQARDAEGRPPRRCSRCRAGYTLRDDSPAPTEAGKP